MGLMDWNMLLKHKQKPYGKDRNRVKQVKGYSLTPKTSSMNLKLE